MSGMNDGCNALVDGSVSCIPFISSFTFEKVICYSINLRSQIHVVGRLAKIVVPSISFVAFSNSWFESAHPGINSGACKKAAAPGPADIIFIALL